MKGENPPSRDSLDQLQSAVRLVSVITESPSTSILFKGLATIYRLEIVFTKAAPAFDNLFMGCVFNIMHKTVEKHFIEVHIHANS